MVQNSKDNPQEERNIIGGCGRKWIKTIRWHRVLVNVRISLGISMKKRKKNGASLPERRISNGYS